MTHLFPDRSLGANGPRLIYPFELDGNTRLLDPHKAAGGLMAGTTELATQLLEEAVERFELAADKDPEYATAFINRACVADLLGRREEAAEFAHKAQRLASRQEQVISLANAHIALAIIASHDPKQKAYVTQQLRFAQEGNAGLAQLNALLIAGRKPEALSPAKLLAIPETIADFQAGQLLHDPSHRILQIPATTAAPSPMTLYVDQSKSWQSLVILTDYRAIYLIKTRPRYRGATAREIRIGSTLGEVIAAYGQPTYVQPARRGLYRIYRDAGIAFRSDEQDIVQEWIIYSVKDG